MSDDLVNRLRFGSLTHIGASKMNLEAADRIEELQARAESAEAKLEKAVYAMEVWLQAQEPDIDIAIKLMHDTLTKLKEKPMSGQWEAITDAAHQVHKDGGRELARLVIEADDLIEGLEAQLKDTLDRETASQKRHDEKVEALEAKLETAKCYFSMMVGGTVRCEIDGFSKRHESWDSNLARRALAELEGDDE